jgi:hypothetical protein
MRRHIRATGYKSGDRVTLHTLFGGTGGQQEESWFFTEDLVRLSRKGSVWHAMPTPAGQRFRNNFALAWVSVFWLTVIWGNVGAVCAAAAIMTATFAWNLWATVHGRRAHT